MIKQEQPPLKSGAGCVKGDFQARFRDNVRVKFPCGTRLPPSVGNRNDNHKLKSKTIVKVQKKEILTRQESPHISRLSVFYFLPTAHFLKQLPTHIVHIAKALQVNAETKALPKSAILLTHETTVHLNNTFLQK